MSDRVYLDWNATTPLRREARAAMAAALELSGNPSSVHAEGRHARRLSRRRGSCRRGGGLPSPEMSSLCPLEPRPNALALTPGFGEVRASGRKIAGLGHRACLRLAGGRFPGPAISPIEVTGSGVVDLARLRHCSRVDRRPWCRSCRPITRPARCSRVTEAAEIVHAAGGLLHVDAIQALGKIPFDINVLRPIW